MAVTVCSGITVTFLTFLSCVHMHKLYSSYFTFSHERQENKNSADKISEFRAETKLTCALRCSTKTNCDEATFYRYTKKCFLYQNKEKGSTEPAYANEDGNTRSNIVTMRKVSINPRLINRGCTSGNNEDEHECDDDESDNDDKDKGYPFRTKAGENKTDKSSCSSILRQNSSNQNGFYNITVGNTTWKTWCKMGGIPGCGSGAWTLVMSIQGSRKTFSYDSHHWTSRSSYYETQAHRKQNKLLGYSLSSFTRICVKLTFPPSDRNATILLNYTARSLHSVFQVGVNNNWPADFTTMKQFPWTPSYINTSCFVQGFNLVARAPLHPRMKIKSRIGVQSQHLRCAQPYLVRGVGIGYQHHYPPISEISCGEIIIRHQKPKPETYPAFCRIYIQ